MELVFRGQPRPVLRGGASTLPNFGILLHLYLHRLTPNHHVRQGSTGGRGVFLGVSHASYPKREEPQRSSIFRFPSIYVYIL